MVGLLRLYLFSISLMLLSGTEPALFAQNAADPIQDLVGEWYVVGSATTITIKSNHVVQHSRWGRGDIKWDNADYFLIKYRDRAMVCNYIIRINPPNELSALRWENLDPAECDLGELRRQPSDSGPLPKNSGAVTAPVPGGGDAEAKEAINSGRPGLPGKAAAQGPPAKPMEPVKLKPGDIFRDCEECPELAVLPGGPFTMGSPLSEHGRTADEGPQHNVVIGQFAIGRTAVTRKQFAAFVADTGYNYANSCRAVAGSKFEELRGFSFLNPGIAQDDRHPAVCVSWYDALAYVSWLSQKTGKPYRLPSEAEREYATRAGTSTPYHFGASISTAVANFDPGGPPGSGPSAVGKGTLPVESFESNAFGLYQMHGNAAEWTQDCWTGAYDHAPENGTAWTAGDCAKRVLRGGAWGYRAPQLRSAYREAVLADFRYFHVGFRVARAADGQQAGPRTAAKW